MASSRSRPAMVAEPSSGRCPMVNRCRNSNVKTNVWWNRRRLARRVPGRAVRAGKRLLFDAKTGKLARTLIGTADHAVDFSPDGRLLAGGGLDVSRVNVWDAATGALLFGLKTGEAVGSTGRIESIAFSPDGALLAAAGDPPSVFIWDVKTKQVKRRLETSSGHFERLAFSPDGERLATVSRWPQREARLWSLDDGKTLWRLPSSGSLNDVVFSTDGEVVYTADRGRGEIRALQRATGDVIATATSKSFSVNVLAPVGERSLLAAGGYHWPQRFTPTGDYAIRLWKLPESVWPQSGDKTDIGKPGEENPGSWQNRGTAPRRFHAAALAILEISFCV